MRTLNAIMAAKVPHAGDGKDQRRKKSATVTVVSDPLQFDLAFTHVFPFSLSLPVAAQMCDQGGDIF